MNIFAVGNSTKVVLNKKGVSDNWEEKLMSEGVENYSVKDVINFADKHHLENLIAIDNTASALCLTCHDK